MNFAKDETGGRQAAIRGLRAYHAEVRKDIERLKRDLLAVERSMSLLSGAANLDAQGSGPKELSYAGLRPQRAVEKFLRQHPGKSFKPSVVAKRLLRGGLPKTAKAFTASIAGALDRAVKKGVARKSRNEQGRNVYSFRQGGTMHKEMRHETLLSPTE